MFKTLFAKDTIPILEQSLSFYHQRQRVLANNLANIDTPFYRTQDLPVGEFQAALSEAIRERDEEHPRSFRMPEIGNIAPADGGFVRVKPIDLEGELTLRHTRNNVTIETEATKLAKNSLITMVTNRLLAKKYQALHSAITERAL